MRSRVRYQVYLDGRLLKVTDRINIGGTGNLPGYDPPEDHPQANFIDGRYEWRIDDAPVAEDVARAMLREAGLDVSVGGYVTRDGERV